MSRQSWRTVRSRRTRTRQWICNISNCGQVANATGERERITLHPYRSFSNDLKPSGLVWSVCCTTWKNGKHPQMQPIQNDSQRIWNPAFLCQILGQPIDYLTLTCTHSSLRLYYQELDVYWKRNGRDWAQRLQCCNVNEPVVWATQDI